MKKKKIACLDCDGTGIITVHATSDDSTWQHTCVSCNGTGEEVVYLSPKGEEF